MTDPQVKDLKKIIEDVIQDKVNGKIDRVSQELKIYIKDDTEWKERAQAAIDLGNNVNGFGKVIGWVLVPISAIGACWGIIVWIGKLLNSAK